jgi:hypothetical protein
MSWPANWITAALESAGIDATPATMVTMRAWHKSTPVSSYSNNPIGMPAGTVGARPYVGTKYAAFVSMSQFYTAFASFMESYQGQQVKAAMLRTIPYGAVWRLVSQLGWPGSDTETDYPSRLLDLTDSAYRHSVQAAVAATRKTSGVISAPSHVKAEIIEQARMTTEAARALRGMANATPEIMRRRNGNSLHIPDSFPGAGHGD